MNNRHRFLVLYSLYIKHYTGNPGFHATDALLKEEDLKYIDKQLLVGEIIYLTEYGLIGRPNSGLYTYPDRICIKSEGIDTVDMILKEYLQFLRRRLDDQSLYEYKHVSAMAEGTSKISQLYTYLKERRNVFEEYLLSTNVFERMTLSANVIPYIQPNRFSARENFAKEMDSIHTISIQERVKRLEDAFMERKSSFRYDKSTNSESKMIEKRISKAVAGFVNSEGGILYIGIDDKGNVVGLSNDYQYVRNQNADGFELELRNSMRKYLKGLIDDLIYVKFHILAGQDVCEIFVKPSSTPITLHDGTEHKFYARIDNSTKLHNLVEALDYCRRHFWTYNITF